tara:strand:- start:8905 stop:9147 length:243 start_codon:yes stop_codon:yes gene_type:complete
MHKDVPGILAVQLKFHSQEISCLFEVSQAVSMTIKSVVAGEPFVITTRHDDVVLFNVVTLDGKYWISIVRKDFSAGFQTN